MLNRPLPQAVLTNRHQGEVIVMNEDYLWDKTGEDPEIEKLENALAVFRYKETAPPELPAKVLPFKKKETPRSFIRYAYAAAACAAFVFISLGVFLQISNKPGEVMGDVTGIYLPQTNFENPTETFMPLVQKSRAPKEAVKPDVVRVKKSVPAARNQNKLIAHNKRIKKPEETLTAEEQYAYNQLMLALSITGSKLRLVSDKIEGTEKQKAVNKDGQ